MHGLLIINGRKKEERRSASDNAYGQLYLSDSFNSTEERKFLQNKQIE